MQLDLYGILWIWSPLLLILIKGQLGFFSHNCSCKSDIDRSSWAHESCCWWAYLLLIFVMYFGLPILLFITFPLELKCMIICEPMIEGQSENTVADIESMVRSFIEKVYTIFWCFLTIIYFFIQKVVQAPVDWLKLGTIMMFIAEHSLSYS